MFLMMIFTISLLATEAVSRFTERKLGVSVLTFYKSKIAFTERKNGVILT